MITNEYEDTIQIKKKDTAFDVTVTGFDRNYREDLHKLLDKMIDDSEKTGVLSYCGIDGKRETYYLTLTYDK